MFARAVKTCKSKQQDEARVKQLDSDFEAMAEDLKTTLVDKIMTITDGWPAVKDVKDFMDQPMLLPRVRNSQLAS